MEYNGVPIPRPDGYKGVRTVIKMMVAAQIVSLFAKVAPRLAFNTIERAAQVSLYWMVATKDRVFDKERQDKNIKQTLATLADLQKERARIFS